MCNYEMNSYCCFWPPNPKPRSGIAGATAIVPAWAQIECLHGGSLVQNLDLVSRAMSPSPGALLANFFAKVDRWPKPLLAIEHVLTGACRNMHSLERTLGAQLVAGTEESLTANESWQCMGCARPAAQGDDCSSASLVPHTELRCASETLPIHRERVCTDLSKADVSWPGEKIDQPMTGPSLPQVRRRERTQSASH